MCLLIILVERTEIIFKTSSVSPLTFMKFLRQYVEYFPGIEAVTHLGSTTDLVEQNDDILVHIEKGMIGPLYIRYG